MTRARLREAARVLRERAVAAAHGAPGPWRTWITSDRKWTIVDSNSHGTLAPARCVDDDVADYIATVHPGVGVALADWLDNAAEDAEMVQPGGGLEHFPDIRVSFNTEKALALADLILGDDR